MRHFRSLISYYDPRFLSTLVYMLQNTEYAIGPYLRWFWRTEDFYTVRRRRVLEFTLPTRVLLVGLRIAIAGYLTAGFLLIIQGMLGTVSYGIYFGLVMIIIYPVFWAHVLAVPVLVGRTLIIAPRQRKQIQASSLTFASHPGMRIAIAGSYGKTTLKELLRDVLSEGLKVAATPANKNVAISHARFAATLNGDEDVLIIEYGEGEPGDVVRFCRITHPTHGIITGLAPAHLDRYKTLQAAGDDIFALATYLGNQQVFVNSDSEPLADYIMPMHEVYNEHGALGWRVRKVLVAHDGISFELHKDAHVIELKSGLLGRHQVGVLSLVAALAIEFGLTIKQVEKAIGGTKPFEHRMEPRYLGDALLIDDTYNGNIEGVRVGVRLLADLAAKRKIYVTPGLVDQGADTASIHSELGGLIASAKPDIVVLMQNSTTKHIKRGLIEAGYDGEVRIEQDPLTFYSHLEHFVAAGDVVLMQNDWTDNYA